MRRGSRRSAVLGVVLSTLSLLGAVVASGVLAPAPAGADSLSQANGQGSTYAAEAFQEWTQEAQNQGLSVNYTPTGSPTGLGAFASNTADFAGTEAEYSSLNGSTSYPVPRGYEYTPDVAGATAIMYHVSLNADGSGPVDYLHLSRLTVAKIFMGKINNWDDPAISADNKGLRLPNKQIVIDYRSGQSGTTALFYDFVAKTDPTDYASWTSNEGFDPTHRIIEIDNGTTIQSPEWMGYNGSDQQAEAIASTAGLWSIGYDEFAYSKVYNDDVAWIENASGNWVQPYAVNIAAALQTAVLAPDTSQNLDGVYSSTNPLAYPISAYSYILVQCAPTSSRPTCVKPYSDPGLTNTMAKFMRYIACAGQVKMAQIGYSPLPPQLSQFLANAIGWMTNQPAEQLNAANCSNPQFVNDNLGTGAQPKPDPTKGVTSEGPGPGGSGSPTGGTQSPTGGTNPLQGGQAVYPAGGTNKNNGGAVGSRVATVGGHQLTGGSTNWLGPHPVANSLATDTTAPWPLLALMVVLLVPFALLSVRRRPRLKAVAGGPHGDR
jgi:phosphate transport system substrate-binding protein